MYERTCPECQSTDHHLGYGLGGVYIVCEGCCAVLASRPDIDAAPMNLTDDEAEAWVEKGLYLRPGAEAKDPDDDSIFRAPAYREMAPT